MALVRINCRVCARAGHPKQNHSIIEEFTNLPPNIVCVQCHGCGVMGIEVLLDCEIPTAEDILNDK